MSEQKSDYRLPSKSILLLFGAAAGSVSVVSLQLACWIAFFQDTIHWVIGSIIGAIAGALIGVFANNRIMRVPLIILGLVLSPFVGGAVGFAVGMAIFLCIYTSKDPIVGLPVEIGFLGAMGGPALYCFLVFLRK